MSLVNVSSPGAINFVKCPSYPHSVGWEKGRAFDLVVEIQHLDYTLDDSTDINVPAPWIKLLCHNPFQGRYVPPTGGGGAYC